MTPQQISVKLQSMKNRSFKYGNHIHVVSSFKINTSDESFHLITDKERFKRTFAQAEPFFKHWFDTPENRQTDAVVQRVKNSNEEIGNQTDEPEGTAGTTENGVALISESKTDTLADDLVKILKDNIAKVSSNPNYTKQAQAVEKSVGTILNVKRLQLDVHKALNAKK